MERFIKNTFVFTLIGLLVFPSFFYLKYHVNDIKNLIGYDVYHSIFKSQSKKKGVNTLLLGDSVGKQAYDNRSYNDSIYSLACNQAISLIGQYILLENFLETFESPENLEVILIYRPSSFNNDLDQPYTFNYFLKPFYDDKISKILTSHAENKIKKIPYYYLAKYKPIKKSNWSPSYMISNNYTNNFKISKTSSEYLNKINNLCISKKVKSFKIICPFMSNQFSFKDFSIFKKNIEDYNLTQVFDGYFNKIIFLDKSLFMDGVHLKDKSTLPNNYLDI